MKMVKKIILIMISFFVISANTVYADEKNEFDDYVYNHFYDFICCESLNKAEIRIGSGIKVISDDENEMKVYPIYIKGELKLVFEVYKTNGVFGGTLSGNMVEPLSLLMKCSNGKIGIYEIKGKIVGCTEKDFIDFQTLRISPLETIKDMRLTAIDYCFGTVEYNAYEKNINDQPFYSINSIPSWTPYWNSYNAMYGCVPQCLYNIFRNYGKNYSDWTEVNNEMRTANNASWLYNYNHAQIQNYINSKGLYCAYSNTVGKLAFTSCDSILSNNRYIMAVSTSSSGNQHATVIIGTYVSNGTQFIKMFDPHGSTNSRIFNTTYSNPSFYTDGETFVWNYGYYSHLTY